MTSFLTRLILPLCGLCAALLGVTLLLSTLIPIPPHPSLLTSNPCALPCVYDVIPGITSRNDAIVVYERLGLSYSFLNPTQSSVYVVHQSSSAPAILALLNFGFSSGTNVLGVQLYQMASGHDLGTLSDFLLAGYLPTSVFSACENPQRIIITFGDQTVFVQVALDAGLTPDTSLLMVGTAVDADALRRSLRTFGCTDQSDWHGFAAPRKYQPAS